MIKVEIFYIILGLFLGFLIVYITAPSPRIVLKKPSINTINNTTYIDEKGQCYKYFPVEVECQTLKKS